MSDPTPIPPAPRWNADLVFAALGDPSRRRLMVSLAGRPLQTATDLRGATGKRLDATLKHLVALRAAKLVVAEENPRDGRRMVYRLSPDVTVRRTETALELDFGCGVVRV
jgi:DNA-binding transcriptional ArsR family regulator